MSAGNDATNGEGPRQDFFSTLDARAGIDASARRDAHEPGEAEVTPDWVEGVLARRSFSAEASVIGAASGPRRWMLAAVLLLGVMVLAMSPWIWSGRNSRDELTLEKALLVATDAQYSWESRMVAVGRLSGFLKRGVQAVEYWLDDPSVYQHARDSLSEWQRALVPMATGATSQPGQIREQPYAEILELVQSGECDAIRDIPKHWKDALGVMLGLEQVAPPTKQKSLAILLNRARQQVAKALR